MSTPYNGRICVGAVEATVRIANVDARRWVGELAEVHPASSFASGEVTATLLDQPRPGWQSPANVEALPDGSAQLVGSRRFNPPTLRR